ncbi:hypothetical protein BB560_001981 [Smittium megazygosporum]|uniref:Uncharacterized protein n=1 Tax=Smittium megazygosporum TaxID=133381 RepID=A0A2T9ZG09_9FUNG|nr:hypothetical protein BB560_001981 [Smittium megazygosporum]
MNTQKPLSSSEDVGNNRYNNIESPKNGETMNNPGKRKLGKIVEFTVLELKPLIPVSNDAKIMMEEKIVPDYENMLTTCKFCKSDAGNTLSNSIQNTLNKFFNKTQNHTITLKKNHQTRTVSPINSKTTKENFYLQKINLNTGLNPETELKALNEAQNHKQTISLSCETDPNKIKPTKNTVKVMIGKKYGKWIQSGAQYVAILINNKNRKIKATLQQKDNSSFELYTTFGKATNTILLGDFSITKRKIKARVDHIIASDNLTDKFNNMITTVGNKSDHLQSSVPFAFNQENDIHSEWSYDNSIFETQKYREKSVGVMEILKNIDPEDIKKS